MLDKFSKLITPDFDIEQYLQLKLIHHLYFNDNHNYYYSKLCL